MRIALLALSFVSLAACGGPDTSQANNSSANTSETASPPPTAAASAVEPLATQPVSKADAAKVMHERHEGMEGLGKATKAIKRQLAGSSPDLAAIRTAARSITEFAPKIPSLFPPGTGPDVGKTGAKSEIWQSPQDFATKAHDFNAAARLFESAAAGGNVESIKAGFADLGKTCKACHDKYRSEMKH